MAEYTNNFPRSNLKVNKTGERFGCRLYTIPSYAHLSCARLCVCTKLCRKFSQRGNAVQVLPAKSEGQPVMPYQSAVVFAVLVGQVSNGGCNAGIEELLPLVKVALMDFI